MIFHVRSKEWYLDKLTILYSNEIDEQFGVDFCSGKPYRQRDRFCTYDDHTVNKSFSFRMFLTTIADDSDCLCMPED